MSPHALHRGGPARRGFTLVETITAASLTAVLAMSSTALVYTSVGAYRDATTRAQLAEESSAAMDRLTRALWSIGRDSTAPIIAPAIASLAPTSIVWNGNWSLTLTGDQLMISENGATARPILRNVTAFSIQALDQTNTAMAATLTAAATQPIRRLQIQITVSRNGVDETLRSKVFIRSTMTGAAIGT